MINPMRNSIQYREQWGDMSAIVVDRLDAILKAGCYVPRYYRAPSNDLEQLAGPNGYLRYSLAIPPGSWIYGVWRSPTTGFAAAPTFWVQITDVGLNHKLFSNPIPEKFLGANQTDYAFLFDYPYPVVAPGVFLCEFWNPNNATNQVEVTFGVAQVDPDTLEIEKVA